MEGIRQIVVAEITITVAGRSETITMYYTYMFNALKILSPSISDSDRRVRLWEVKAVDERCAAQHKGLVATVTDSVHSKSYVIDPEYAFQPSNLFFDSALYHEKLNADLPRGAEHIITVEVSTANRQIDGEPKFYYRTYDSWEDVRILFHRFATRIFGGTEKEHKDVSIYISPAISYENAAELEGGIDIEDDSFDSDQDYCDYIAEKYLHSEYGGDWACIRGKQYAVNLRKKDCIFSTTWWGNRFASK